MIAGGALVLLTIALTCIAKAPSAGTETLAAFEHESACAVATRAAPTRTERMGICEGAGTVSMRRRAARGLRPTFDVDKRRRTTK